MILSKTNLTAVKLTKDSKQIPALNNIHVRKDGTTVGASNDIVLCVSPVTSEVKEETVIEESTLDEDVTIPADAVKDALKNIPPDKKFGGLLEHCDLEVINGKGIFTLKDGKKWRKISANPYKHGFIKFKQILQRVLSNSRASMRVVVNLNRLITLLQTIKEMCPDSTGENPVFIEFTNHNDMILRAVNQKNGQRVLGTMTSYKGVEGKWLEKDEWEYGFTSGGKRVKKKRREV